MRIKPTLATLSVAIVMLAAPGCGSDDASDAVATTASTAKPASGGSVTTVAGGRSSTSQASAAVDLPDGWPDEIVIPSGATVISSTGSATNGSFSVLATLDDAKAAFDELKAGLSGAGYEVVNAQFTPSDKGGYGSISARGEEYTVAIAFGPDATGDTSQATINVAEVDG